MRLRRKLKTSDLIYHKTVITKSVGTVTYRKKLPPIKSHDPLIKCSSGGGGGIYQRCLRPVLLYYCETRELTVADEANLRGVERRLIRMCGVRLVDRVSTVVWVLS